MADHRLDLWATTGLLPRLTELAKTGLSRYEIAAVLNQEYGYHFNRNMVCGKLHRLKQPTADNSAKLRVNRKLTELKAAPPPPVRPAATKPPSLKLARHSTDPCCWPLGEDGACPRTATIGAYCTDHARLAYRQMPTKERNAIFMEQRHGTTQSR